MLTMVGLQAAYAQAAAPMAIEVIGEHQVELQPLTVTDGLSQGLVLGMLADSKGYLWLATKEGLNRYDGSSIKVFRHDVNDPTSIGNNMGGALMEDEDGYIWIWLDIYGLDRFDPRTERFLHLTYPEYLAAYQAAPNKNALYNDAAGNLIIPNPKTNTNDTLFSSDYNIDIGQSKLQWCGLEALAEQINVWKQRTRIMNQLITYDNNVWFHYGDSIFRFWKHMPAEAQPESYKFGSTIRVFTDDARKHVYVAARDTVFKYNSTRNVFEAILVLPQGNYQLAYFTGDMQHQMLVNCKGSKTLVTDLKTGKARWISPRAKKGVPLPDNETYGLINDANDNLYLATPGWGIYKITADHTLFTVHTYGALPFLQQMRMDSRHFKNAYVDSLKHVWTWLDTTQLLPQQYFIGLQLTLVLTITDDGYIYFNAGLRHIPDHLFIGKYHVNTQQITKVFEEHIPGAYYPGMPRMLSKTDSLIWFGDRPKDGRTNLYSVDETTGERNTYPFPIVSETGGYDFINDYYQNDAGVFWLGTIQGLFRFDTKSKDWQHFKNMPTDTTSLSGNMIYCILPDPVAPDSILWIGTNGGGLNKFDIKAGTFKRYGTEHGLPNNVIYGVLADARNNLWISTNNGLCLFNPKTLQTRTFTVAHGLPGNEFNRYQFAQEADGSMHFGLVAGTIHFQPEDFYDQQNNNQLVINQLKLLNVPVKVRRQHEAKNKGSYVLEQAMEYTEELVFKYDERMITLGFSLLDLSTPSENTYKYMLEGLNTDWVDNGNNQWATFTNLDPGEYLFKVLGRNSSGIWTAEPTTLKLTILPPWWATWWFRALMALAAASSLYAFYRYRLQQALKEVQLRNQIAQDLHDEIGSTLSSVSLYTAVIEKKAPNMPDDVKRILGKISASVLEMMSAMNDIVWTINATNNNTTELVDRMRAFAVNMTEAKEMQLRFDVKGDLERVQLNMIDRKNGYLLVKEAITNAVKHARATQLSVTISVVDHTLHIAIADNGVGFDTAADNSGSLSGNGLLGMHLRAKESRAGLDIQSTTGQGTIISFRLKTS